MCGSCTQVSVIPTRAVMPPTPADAPRLLVRHACSKQVLWLQAHVQAAAMVDRSQQDPFAHIFRVLDAAKLKDRLTLKPGQHLLAGVLPRSSRCIPPPRQGRCTAMAASRCGAGGLSWGRGRAGAATGA